jgi:peptidoglycan/LPS O-acetylase OafA/YrhL
MRQNITTLFEYLLVIYLVLLLIEKLWPASVKSYLNLNYLLFAVLAIGIVSMLCSSKKLEKEQFWKGYAAALGLASALVVLSSLSNQGWLRFAIAALTGIFVWLSCLLRSEERRVGKEC